jgi:hypothetical protein
MWKVREVVDEAMSEEETENPTPTPTDELPF